MQGIAKLVNFIQRPPAKSSAGLELLLRDAGNGMLFRVVVRQLSVRNFVQQRLVRPDAAPELHITVERLLPKMP
jgi:hypothetical protein